MTEIVKIGTAEMRLQDCMEYMRGLPDKAFDLAIVDPPYGLGHKKLTAGGTWAKKYQITGAHWDIPPDKQYFEELFRVSKNWIIWGGNYFSEHIPPARCFIAWIKSNMAGMRTMSDCELALTSFDKNSRHIKMTSQSTGKRVHITQKPIKLYEWILTNYAKPGQRILDTHLGSMSSVIACLNHGFEIVGCELDVDYFKAGVERVRKSQQQQRLFEPMSFYQRERTDE